MVFSNVIVENTGKLKQAQELQSLYNGRILPLFESWHAGGSGLLLVETELISMRIVSRVMRFFGGAWFPGLSHIDMDLRLIDATTGEEIANVQIRKKTTNYGAAFSGVSDETEVVQPLRKRSLRYPLRVPRQSYPKTTPRPKPDRLKIEADRERALRELLRQKPKPEVEPTNPQTPAPRPSR